MEITEIKHEELGALEVFKGEVWLVADEEHYGDTQPDFDKKDFTLVAKEGECIIGYLSVAIDSGVAQLEPLMVKPDLKGKGIGTALLKAAEQKARDLGAHKIWLETGSEWRAKAFYEKHGYGVRSVLPNHSAGREFVLMDKML